MKRIVSAIMLVLMLTSSVFALEKLEYDRLKANHKSIAEAEQRVREAYSKLMRVIPSTREREIRESQMEWQRVGRDSAAIKYKSEGYSMAKAYTMAMNDRVKELTRLYNLYAAKKRK